MQNQRGRVIELRHEIGLRLRAKATARSHPSEQTLNKTLNKNVIELQIDFWGLGTDFF